MRFPAPLFRQNPGKAGAAYRLGQCNPTQKPWLAGALGPLGPQMPALCARQALSAGREVGVEAVAQSIAKDVDGNQHAHKHKPR